MDSKKVESVVRLHKEIAEKRKLLEQIKWHSVTITVNASHVPNGFKDELTKYSEKVSLILQMEIQKELTKLEDELETL